MATSADDIIANLLAGTGYGRTVSDYQQQNTQNQLGQQQLATGALQQQALQQKMTQAAQYQAWEQDYAKNPTPQKLAQGVALFPDQADALQKSYQIMDEPARISRVTQLSQIYNAAKSGRSDLASQQIDGIINAEKQQGVDTSEAEQVKAALASGDKDALTRLQAFAQAHLAAASPDFAKAIGITGNDKDSTHVINPGGALVDNSGRELYRASDRPKQIQVPIFDADGHRIGTQLVPEGGDPASGGGASVSPSGAPQSSANALAGNNPGGINDGAFAKTQPGYSGANGRFASFNSLQDGINAQKALLGSYVKRGINTPLAIASRWAPKGDGGNDPAAYARNIAQQMGIGVNDKITPADIDHFQHAQAMQENSMYGQAATQAGLKQGQNGYFGPVGGTAASAPGDITKTGDAYLATLPGPLAAQVKALSEGRLQIPTGAALRSPQVQQLWAAASQYDPDLDQANAKTRYATRKEFTSGKAAANITSFNTALHHIDTLSHAADDLSNSSIPLWNTIGNATNSAMGAAAVPKFNAAKQAVVDELERAFRGTSGTLAGIKGWEEAINSSSSPAQIHGVLTQMADLLAGRIEALGEQYSQGMGKSVDGINLLDSKARATLKRFGSGYGDAAQVASGGAAPAAPPPGGKQIGTYQGKPVFQLPNGKRVVAQ